MVQKQYEWETVVHKVGSSFAFIFFNCIDDRGLSYIQCGIGKIFPPA